MRIRLKCKQCGEIVMCDDRVLDTPVQCGDCGFPISIETYPKLRRLKADRDAKRKQQAADHERGQRRVKQPPPSIEDHLDGVTDKASDPSRAGQMNPDVEIRIQIIGPIKWYRSMWSRYRTATAFVHGAVLATLVIWWVQLGPHAPQPVRTLPPGPVAVPVVAQESPSPATGQLKPLAELEPTFRECGLWRLGPPTQGILRGRPLTETSFGPDANRPTIAIKVWTDRQGFTRAISAITPGSDTIDAIPDEDIRVHTIASTMTVYLVLGQTICSSILHPLEENEGYMPASADIASGGEDLYGRQAVTVCKREHIDGFDVDYTRLGRRVGDTTQQMFNSIIVKDGTW